MLDLTGHSTRKGKADAIANTKKYYEAKGIDTELLDYLETLARAQNSGEMTSEDVMEKIGNLIALSFTPAFEEFAASLKAIPSLAEDGVTYDEIGDKLGDIRDGMEDIAKNSKVYGQPIVGGADYIELMNRTFENLIARAEAAKTEEEKKKLTKEAYDTKANMIDFALNNFRDISHSEQLDLLDQLAAIDKERADAIRAVLMESMGAFTEKLSEIADKFEAGEISYDRAQEMFRDAVKAFGEVPSGMALEFNKVIENFQKSLTGKQKSAFGDTKGGVSDKITNMYDAVNDINEKYKEIGETWQELLDKKKELQESFDEDKEKILSESGERLRALEEERDAIIGTFNFSETQNERSKRFAAAREVEKNIIQEIADAEKELNELTVEFNESLAEINADLKVLEDRYGSIANLTMMASRETAAAYRSVVEYLMQASAQMETLLGQSLDLVKIWNESGLTGVLGAMEAVEAKVAESAKYVPSIKGGGRSSQHMTEILNPIKTNVGRSSEHMAEIMKASTSSMGKSANVSVNGGGSETAAVSPVEAIHKLLSGFNSPSNTIIHIHDNIDFRGAYGITSETVAEKVYRDIWAPARRRNLGRFMSTKGKVIR
jgi:hypothetical protein